MTLMRITFFVMSPSRHLPVEWSPPLLLFLSLKPIADHCLTASSAEHSRLHDQDLSLVALPDNRIVHTPVSDPHTILDIGCGTGIVTRYIGNTQLPNASHIYGIDLCPIPAPQPREKQAYNITSICYELCRLDPRLQSGSVDFVYSRMLQFGITE